jgi:hypothetical protein
MLFSHKEVRNPVIYSKMDGTGRHNGERDRPNTEKQIHVLSHM